MTSVVGGFTPANCRFQNIPSLKAGRRISARIAMLTLAETATTATTRTLTMTAALSVVSGLIIVSKEA